MTQKIPSELIADDAIDSEHYAAGSIDTVHIADDQITLAKMAGGTDGNIISYDASGNPVAIATGDEGEVLTSAGEGNPPAFAAAGGGGSGLTEADSWELTTPFTGDANPIASNLAQVSGAGFGCLGTGMSESAGIFTFPSTGYWAVLAIFNFRYAGDSRYNQGFISVTTNNADYTNAAEGATATAQVSAAITRTSTSLYALLDVTDTTLVKVRFEIDVREAGVTTHGATDSQTSFHFRKLGDT